MNSGLRIYSAFQGKLKRPASILLLAVLAWWQVGCSGFVSGGSTSGNGGGTPAQLAISGAAASAASSTQVTATWSTNQPANSQIEFGTTASYGSMSALDSTMVTSHQQSLGSLSPGTTYHLRLHSNDANNLAVVSGDLAVTTTLTPDTTAPTVSIVSPNAGVTISGNVTITASASDNVGVASVQFKLDSASVGSAVTAAPYTYLLNTTALSTGNHNLSAVAKDAAGNTTTSAAVTVKVDNTAPPDTTPPTVSITAPAGAATVSGTVTVSANAADSVGVAGVQFQLDGANLGSLDTASPYSASWTTTSASNGSHTLRAIAKDATGNSTTSATVTVTVSNTTPDTTPPTVSITAPAGAATVSGTVTVSANAADNVGVASVQFQLDGANLGSLDTASPYSASWTTTSASNGSHSLRAIAKDAAGNSTTSAAITVTVSNTAPDTTAPSVPSGLSATAISSSQINLTWTASTDNVGVTGYKVFRGGTQIGTATSTTYQDTGLAASTSYSYTAAAYDAANNTSAQSGAASATTQASSGGSGGIPATLGWYQIPNTQMNAVCPAGFNCGNIVANWSGGTADTARNRLIVWGGGHTDYNGNEVYALDLNSLAFLRLNNPSPTASSCVDTLSDGKPNSRHTYAGLSYVPATDQMVATGGSLACSNGDEANDLWTLNMSNLLWAKVCGSGNSCGYNNGLNGKISAFDKNTGDVFIDDRDFLYRFNPSTRVLSRVTGASNTLHTNSEIDPLRKRMYVVGDGAIYYINIDPSSSSYGNSTNVSVGSCSTPANNGYPGMAYDPDRDKIVMWAGGSTFYDITLTGTPSCAADNTYSGGPGNAQGTGTHGRFRYFPALKLFALVNDAAQNAYTLRLTASSGGGGTSGPSISGVAANSITTTGATISWTTDVAATTQVEYGTTTSYGTLGALNSSMVTSHSQALSGMTGGTLYHYRVRSKNASNVESVSGDSAFTTNNTTDTTAPVVTLTAPLANATLTATTTISATATDNVGVAGVQFVLDGANLGAEVTSSPYQLSWNPATTSNGAHLLAARARDAAGNTATSISVPITVSVASGGSTELTLAQRCADSAVSLCYGMDQTSQLDPYISLGNTTPGLDASTKTSSTNGSLHFIVPQTGTAGSAGYWSRTMGRDFNEGQTAYISYRWRADATFINTNYGAAGWKMHIFWSGVGGSCSDLQFVTLNEYYGGYPRAYRSCGTPEIDAALPDGDIAQEFGSDSPVGAGTNGYFCTYRKDNTGENNCALYQPNQWMTFYYKITIGHWNQSDSIFEAWVAYEGQPMKKWLSLHNVMIPNDNTAAKALRQIDLLPYDTGRNSTVSADANVWYSEVIVSGNPIPPPTGPTP